MIEVKNLTKVYTSKKGVNCTALDNVSFTLSNTGMVFVLGKSGSGKSTLLNLLGGLDKITSGDIVASGNKFSTFKEEDYTSYRNDYVGFIFQDYCLFEGMSVKDNIKFALDLQSKPYDKKVSEILEKLEIKQYENRLIKELSGGQKQRVAIARALVKNPKLILADEPTGNLDSKSAKYVLDTLKALSKDNLVVIVSHNQKDAEKYADRIIEIGDGKVVSDLTKCTETEDKLTITEDKVLLPTKRLTEEELAEVNDAVTNRGLKLGQVPERFTKTVAEKVEDKFIKLNKPKLKGKTIFKYSNKMFGRHKISMLMAVILMSFLTIIFGLCQSMVNFDQERAINKAYSGDESGIFRVTKGYTDISVSQGVKTDKISQITDIEVNKFYDSGYEGNVYKLYNYPLSPDSKHNELASGNQIKMKNYNKFFTAETRGVIICTEQFLTDKYGVNGKLDIVKNDKFEEGGIYITDYVADSILFYQHELKYSSILVDGLTLNQAHINGIINTGYKDRYKELIDQVIDILTNGDKADMHMVFQSDMYGEFINEVESFLNVNYSFNTNFVEESSKIRKQVTLFDGEILVNGKTFRINNLSVNNRKTNPVKNDEIILSLQKFNEIFETEYTDASEVDCTNKAITLNVYPVNSSKALNEQRLPDFTKTLKVIRVVNSGNIISTANFETIANMQTVPYELYFDNVNPTLLYNVGKEIKLLPKSQFFDAVLMVSRIAEAMMDFFSIITTIICTVGVVYLVFYGISSVRKGAYEIGVTRAIGGKTIDVVMMFLLQMILLCVLTCIISSAGLVGAINLANGKIVDNFASLFSVSQISRMELVQFFPSVLAVDLAVVFLITLVSAIVPILSIRKVKPINIIKAKD